jgi:type II secretory pathway component PulF
MGDETQCNSSSGLRPSVMTVVITHGIALSITIGLLWIVVPVFGEMFADFSADLPGPTQFMLDLSYLSLRYFPITILLAVALLFGDALLYAWLYRNINRTVALLWFWGVSIALFALAVPLVVLSMFLPIFEIRGVVQ